MAEGGKDHNFGVADVSPISLSPGTSGTAILAEGENVNQNWTNSLVNVVAGNQTNVYSVTSAKREATGTISNAKLIQICNENTMDVTAIDILDDFRHEHLQHPDFEVYPQMREVDVDDYYKGRYGHTQLTQEVGFLRKDRIGGRNIGIDDVVASIWQSEKLSSPETVGITAIVASAGSGKSTLTRRIARQALGISSARNEVEELSSYDIKMVHFIELKDVEVRGEIKPSKFLFGGMYENEMEEEQAFQWLDKHQCDAVLLFDGLDQARWDFNAENIRKMKKHQKASCWTIMYNILSRNILRHVKVFISSREFRISELPAMARPETIITLNGFILEDAHKLFTFLLRESGAELWQKIEYMSPRLLNLVCVPVFLILTAVVMGRDPSKPPPTTVTELYSRIILALQSVENIRNRSQILSIVNKLKALAFQGMKEGRVVFRETDLHMFGVSADEVQDLMTKVPGNNLLSRHLMQGDFTFFFCHQSLQEYLAAIFVAEMEFNEFCRFDEEHLHEERWSIVRRFVSGVIFSKSRNDLKKVSNQTRKRDVLARSILSRLQKDTNGRVRMEAYTAIYESDDDCLMKQLSVIDVSNISLSRDEAHIVGSLAARNGSLGSFILAGCDIDDELMCIISRCMKNPIHVKKVDLCDNNFSATALRSLLGHRRIQSLSGKLDWEVVWLTLDIYYYELKKEEDVIRICSLDAGQFNIKESTLSFERILSLVSVSFFEILFDAEHIKLNEQQHLLLTQDDLRTISDRKIRKISQILLDCTEEEAIDWSAIESSLKKYQVDVLDIAVNGHMSTEDYSRILERVRSISVFGNIHAMFLVERRKDFRNMLDAPLLKKIKYIRCIFSFECRVSVDDISSLVNSSSLNNLTLRYLDEDDMLKGDELQKVLKISNDLDTELVVLCLSSQVNDAWERLDEQVSMGLLQEEFGQPNVNQRLQTREETPSTSKSITETGISSNQVTQLSAISKCSQDDEEETLCKDVTNEPASTHKDVATTNHGGIPLTEPKKIISCKDEGSTESDAVREAQPSFEHSRGPYNQNMSGINIPQRTSGRGSPGQDDMMSEVPQHDNSTNTSREGTSSMHSRNSDEGGGVSYQESDATRETRPEFKSRISDPANNDQLIIYKQIFYDCKIYVIHCYLWIGEKHKSRYEEFLDKGYEEQRVVPVRLNVNQKDGLIIRCEQPGTGLSYHIKRPKRRVNLDNLQAQGDFQIIFRVDPSPDKIVDRFMDFDCEPIANVDTEDTAMRFVTNQDYGVPATQESQSCDPNSNSDDNGVTQSDTTGKRAASEFGTISKSSRERRRKPASSTRPKSHSYGTPSTSSPNSSGRNNEHRSDRAMPHRKRQATRKKIQISKRPKFSDIASSSTQRAVVGDDFQSDQVPQDTESKLSDSDSNLDDQNVTESDSVEKSTTSGNNVARKKETTVSLRRSKYQFNIKLIENKNTTAAGTLVRGGKYQQNNHNSPTTIARIDQKCDESDESTNSDSEIGLT